MYSEYAYNKSSPYIANYVDCQIGQFQNAKMEKIFELIRQFSPEWEQELRTCIDDELKDSVDSIVANRHLIAHGQSVGLTLGRVNRYYINIQKVISLMEKQCNLQ